jgi:apolipoprotein D and lipocalin family protein
MKTKFLCGLLLIVGCVSVPKGIAVVDGFDLNRYLGKWYEIARLDHSFERGLEKVSAEYSPRDDGGVKVINRGYDPQRQAWKEAEGRAYQVAGPNIGQLKVSFFGPFYGGYNIIELDRSGYTYAMVCGPRKSYLWILSRAIDLDPAVLARLVNQAQALGFDTEALIYVNHQDGAL